MVRLPPRRWATFWSAFAHVVRNTVDHGVETSEKRIADGKPERATIRVAIGRDRDRVLISIQDDGPGVDWQVIARRARERGLPAETHAALVAALFTDGISSRAKTTSTSGRGVGLGALRAAVDSLGGELELSSSAEAGTLFRCWLPLGLGDTDPLDREVTVKLEVPAAAATGARTTPAT
jgi:two-component system chemotaxis sensor kinase CheA